MKTYKHIYEKICDIDNIHAAITEAARHKSTRPDVRNILANSDEYARKVQKILINQSFSPRVGKPTIVKDRANGKERTIYKPIFYPDQIIHHAIIRALKPIIMKSMYEYADGSIPKRGSGDALKAVKRWMIEDPKGTKYGASADIRRFYQNINHKTLKKKLSRKIKDTKALRLIFSIIDAYPGLPLGLYTSPWFANFYLTDFDHYVKGIGAHYYIRYADNMILLGGNKKLLHRIIIQMMAYLRNCGLWFKRSWQVFRIASSQRGGREYDVLGYMIRRTNNGIVITLRKCVIKRIARSARIMGEKRRNKEPIGAYEAAQMISRLGLMARANMYGFYGIYVKPYINYKQLRKIISKSTRKEQWHGYQLQESRKYCTAC